MPYRLSPLADSLSASPNAPLTRDVDASPCEQSVVRQSLAGILVREKDRCVWISSSGRAYDAVSAAGFESWQGQFQGQQ
jgi:hypothetical protein